MTRLILNSSVLASGLFTLSLFAVTSIGQPALASAPLMVMETLAPSAELAPTLLRVGASPEALTAAGVSAADTTQAAADLDAWLADHAGEIATADESWATANQAAEAIKRKVKSGQATPTEVASLPGLEASRDAAAATRDSLVDDAFVAATGSLTAAQTSALATIQANSIWSLAVHFLVVDRTQENWVALRNALDEKRIAEKYGESVSAESLTVISGALGSTAVATAKVNVDTNLSAIEAAWNAATN
jgi:hypothetical protein